MHSQSNASSDPEQSPTELLPPSRALAPAPIGAPPDRVRAAIRYL
jgi:hypothetical protein